MRRANQRTVLTLIGLVVIAAGSIIVALGSGSVDLTAADVWRGLVEGEQGLPRTLVSDLRLPRALSAFAVGGLLAVAGTLMQVLLRNPLADPYILGVSGGAAVCALVALLYWSALDAPFVQVQQYQGSGRLYC